MKDRLSKILAKSQVASRRGSETLIFAGKVTVNGKVVQKPQTIVDSEKDEIKVEGKKITLEKKKYYFLLNKPRGFHCSSKRRKKEKLVIDLFKHIPARLFTVGRLDKDTEGLILVTNDGIFANNVIHPKNNITKEYLVKTNAEITHDHLLTISSGTKIEGTHVIPKSVKKVRKGTLKIVLREGKKREVRLLVAKANLEIISLTRIRLGPLQLGKLPLGAYRELTIKEIGHFIGDT